MSGFIYITLIDSEDNYQFTISRFLITPVIVRITFAKKKSRIESDVIIRSLCLGP